MAVECKFCGSENAVKKGCRKLKKTKKQIYLCRDCGHKFSFGLSKKRFDVRVVLNAVCAYNQGYNYDEVCDLVSRKNRVSVSKSAVERWVKEYDLGYLNIRSRIIRKYGPSLIVGRMFKHSDLIYNFRYHKEKLKEFGKFNGLREFISSISRGIDDKLFNSLSSRCSQVKSDVSVSVKVFDNTKLNKKIGSALKVIKSNKQRHSIIEDFLLSCDRDTVAVEVPVWYWDKEKDVGVCGHIDILQVKYGKIWILDYKPNASKENVDSVVSQLFRYALGLSFRTKVGLENIKCAWFDESKEFSFDADKVRIGNERKRT
ncbi:MAG: hypothetical protein ABIH25_02140 [Candidatus Woesearchaeota archaeon]